MRAKATHLAELLYISEGMHQRPYGIHWPLWSQLTQHERDARTGGMEMMLELGHLKPGFD